MDPQKALELRTTLSQWTTSYLGVQVMGKYTSEYGGVRLAGPDGKVIEGHHFEASLQLSKRVADHLSSAEVYWVSPEMLVLLLEAAKSIPTGTILHPLDLPKPNGLVVFADPVIPEDVQEPEIRGYRAIHWHETQVKDLGSEGEPSCLGLFLCEYVDTPRHLSNYGSPALPTHHGGWGFSVDWTDPSRFDADLLLMRKILFAFFRIVQQELIRRTPMMPSRGIGRRILRMGGTVNPIVVCDLRRIRHVGPEREDSMHVEWSHRWIVEGHWRNQYYPSEDVHRPIWIHPHVKGPDDKPLVVKNRISRLIR